MSYDRHHSTRDLADDYRERRKVGAMAQKDALRNQQIAALRAQAASLRAGGITDSFFPAIHSQMGEADIAAAQQKLNRLQAQSKAKPKAAAKPTAKAEAAAPAAAPEAAKKEVAKTPAATKAPVLEKLPDIQPGMPSRTKLLTQTPAGAAAQLRQIASARAEQPKAAEVAKPEAQPQTQPAAMESLPPPNPGANSSLGQLMGRNADLEAAANRDVARSRVPKNVNSAGRQQDTAILASPAPVATGGQANQTGNAIDYNAIRARRDIAEANANKEYADAAPFRGSTPDEISQFYATDPNNSGSVTNVANLELKHQAERKALEAQHAAEVAAAHAGPSAPAAGRSGSSATLMNLPAPGAPAAPAPVPLPPVVTPPNVPNGGADLTAALSGSAALGGAAKAVGRAAVDAAGRSIYGTGQPSSTAPVLGGALGAISGAVPPVPTTPAPEVPGLPPVFHEGDAKWSGETPPVQGPAAPDGLPPGIPRIPGLHYSASPAAAAQSDVLANLPDGMEDRGVDANGNMIRKPMIAAFPDATTLAPTTGVDKGPLDTLPPTPLGLDTNPAGPNGTAYQIAPRPPTPQPSTSPVGTDVSTPSAASPAASPALSEEVTRKKKKLPEFSGF